MSENAKQYLVMIHHHMDDVPFRLTDNLFVARGVALTAPDDGMIPADIMKALRLDTPTTPVCVSIITFEDGVPVSREIVRSYDADCPVEEPVGVTQ